MLWRIASTITTLGFGICAAQAGVSDDLVFCSKLTAAKERIACYDAAARIAAKGAATPKQEPMATRHAANVPGPPILEIRQNPFQGAFAALGGAYGISSPRSVTTFGSPFGGLSDTLSAQGLSGRTSLGYNATFGNFLLGAEISGRFGGESVSTSVSTPAPFPGLQGFSIADYRLKNNAGIHISGRAGLTFDQTLVFMRGGVGVSHISESATVDGRNLLGCGDIFCTTTTGVLGNLKTGSVSKWVPSAVFGAGIEQNVGPIFIRAEGEIEAVAQHQTIFPGMGGAGATAEPYWLARAMASAGIRF